MHLVGHLFRPLFKTVIEVVVVVANVFFYHRIECSDFIIEMGFSKIIESSIDIIYDESLIIGGF